MGTFCRIPENVNINPSNRGWCAEAYIHYRAHRLIVVTFDSVHIVISLEVGLPQVTGSQWSLTFIQPTGMGLEAHISIESRFIPNTGIRVSC